MYPDCLRCGREGHGPACDKCLAKNRAMMRAAELQRIGHPDAKAALRKAQEMVDGNGTTQK